MEQMLTFHVIANPLIPTDPIHSFDAHTTFLLKFCKLFHAKGHVIHFYGVRECRRKVACTRYHSVIRSKKYREARPYFSDARYLVHNKGEVIKRICEEIRSNFYDKFKPVYDKNVNAGDITLHLFDPWCDLSGINVSYGMGGWWTNVIDDVKRGFDNVIFCTPTYEEWSINCFKTTPQKHTSIFPLFDPEDYLYSEVKKEKTYLYLARCTQIKGFLFYLQTAYHNRSGTFLIAGPCEHYDGEENIIRVDGKVINLNLYSNVKYLGILDVERRKTLLSECTALIQPTYYFEPCGFNVIEAAFSGTPVLVSRYGGFVNTVIDGKTGIYLPLGVQACDVDLSALNKISPRDCREHALRMFNNEERYQEFMRYFSQLSN